MEWIILLLALLGYAVLWLWGKNRNYNKLKQEREKWEKASKVSLERSRSVVKGQISEQLFPLKVDCPFQLSDMKFFGQPVDYIVFNGLSEGLVTDIVFVEVKTGSSRLSALQKTIRDAVLAGNISWVTIEEKHGDL